jgi:phosphate transport system substrate-binding protein
VKKRDYVPSAQKMAGHEQIAAEVGRNAMEVGYVGLAYMKTGGIKVVPIDGEMPTQQSVIAKRWPYARPTFYYTNGEPSGVARDFLQFTISPDGQKIVDRVGFVPIREIK